MLKKIRENKGFTLAELLVVVAIIGVLVAVSIPIFTSQLEKAREATDLANIRAAKAAAVAAYLDEEKIGDQQLGSTQTGDVTLKYDANNGKLVAESETPTKYGKGTTTLGSENNAQLGYDPNKAAADVFTVKIAKDGTVTITSNKD
jgi:prepilin-type N-terminal cleavage/methylation domain-containing protein